MILLTETKNSYHRPDPAFTYLLSLFLFLTGIAWGIAYANTVSQTIRVALFFVFIHFLGASLIVATLMFFLVGRVLGRRRQGLFGPPVGGEEALEFGYCFDVWHPLSPSKFGPRMCIELTLLIGFDSRVPSTLVFPLRLAIPAYAAHSAGLLGVQSVWKHHVFAGVELLLCHHFFGLQCATIPSSHRSRFSPDTHARGLVDHQSVHLRLRDKPCASAMVWHETAQTGVKFATKGGTLKRRGVSVLKHKSFAVQLETTPTLRHSDWSVCVYH
nr:protein unc-50 like a [Quercus suber]